MPWRPRWPLRRNEDSVEFLRVDYTHFEERFGLGIRSTSWRLAAEVALNREMSLHFTWSRPGRTPLDIARRTSPARRLELEYTYAFGR